jgi:hypothetical protein
MLTAKYAKDRLCVNDIAAPERITDSRRRGNLLLLWTDSQLTWGDITIICQTVH